MGIYRYYLATQRLPYFFITPIQTQEIQGRKPYISAINFQLNSLAPTIVVTQGLLKNKIRLNLVYILLLQQKLWYS